MLRIICVIFLLFIYNTPIKAQSSFVINWGCKDGFADFDFLEHDGTYVFCGTDAKIDSLGYMKDGDLMLIKWQPGGDSIVKKYLPDNFKTGCLQEIRIKEDNGYLVVGRLNRHFDFNLNVDTEALYIAAFDSALNLKWEHIEPMPDRKGLDWIKICKNSDGDWVGVFFIEKLIPGLGWQGERYVFKISEDGLFSNYKIIETTNRWPFDIIQRIAKNEYYIFGEQYHDSIAAVLDSNLNLIKYNCVFPMKSIKPYFNSVVASNSDTFFITGNDVNYDPAIFKVVDTDSLFINLQKWSKTSNRSCMLACYRSLHNNIITKRLYMAANMDIGILHIYIVCYDSLMNRIYEKTIKSNFEDGGISNIFATSDNGLLISIGRSQDGNFYYRYIIKIDSNGNTVWQKELPFISRKKLLWHIYPNPASQELKLQYIGNGLKIEKTQMIKFFDIQLKPVFEYILPYTTTTLDISHLTNGTYLYQIIQNKQIIQQGKIIKQ